MREFLRPAILLTFFLGFSSGLPFSVVDSVLQAWLKDSQVPVSQIALYAWVSLPYSTKFIWAPLLDHYSPPFLGRRRGWAVLIQVLLIIVLATLGLFSPAEEPLLIGGLAMLTAFLSASQDIVLDAHRRESLNDHELGLGSTLFVNGYRVGMIISSSVALELSKYFHWYQVFCGLALLMGVGILAVLFAPEPEVERIKERSFKKIFTEPFLEFFSREKVAVLIAFIFLYKIGDTMANTLRTTFLLDIGYTKEGIARFANAVGLAASIAGGFLGGFSILKLGIVRCLWLFGIFQAIGILGFWLLSWMPPSNTLLAAVISVENSSIGMGTAAYVAFIASICDRRFSGTQYAALTSLMRIPSIALASVTGSIVTVLGWSTFFLTCACAAIPGLAILPLAASAAKRYWDKKKV